MTPGASAERVNGLLSVVKRTRGTTQEAFEVEVEAGAGMAVGSAGAELTSRATVMREARIALICIFYEYRCKMLRESWKEKRLREFF